MRTIDRAASFIYALKRRLPGFELPPLQIGDLHIKLPIFQGGMGVGISLSGLSSAVANSGGIGTIAANGIGLTRKDYFRDGRAANIKAFIDEIRKAKAASAGVIAVNIMVALQDFSQLLMTAIEQRVDMIVMGAGLPVKNIPVKLIREHNIKVVPIVSSPRAAELICKMWKRIYQDLPDAMIVEGPQAGGHLGFSLDELNDNSSSLESLVPRVINTLKPYREEFQRHIPVIAAGGIQTGEDIHRMINLGADAVQLGTRFAATDECDADIRFKEAIISCRKEDIGIINSPVGMPGRALVNTFLKDAQFKKRSFTCPWQCLAGCRADKAYYCISLALNNARIGRLDRGFVFVGSNAYQIKQIIPVSMLIKELIHSYKQEKLKEFLQNSIDFSGLFRPAEAVVS